MIGRLPDDLVAELSAGFRFTKEYGGPLSTEKRSGRGVHSFLVHLASGVATVSGFKRVILLQVDPDRTVHVLHSLLSLLVNLYSTAQQIFFCRGELPR